jgi:hypothetical protein
MVEEGKFERMKDEGCDALSKKETHSLKGTSLYFVIPQTPEWMGHCLCALA